MVVEILCMGCWLSIILVLHLLLCVHSQMMKSEGQTSPPREVAANILKHLKAPPAIIEKVNLVLLPRPGECVILPGMGWH